MCQEKLSAVISLGICLVFDMFQSLNRLTIFGITYFHTNHLFKPESYCVSFKCVFPVDFL